jgi:hypothetical protein
MNAINPKMQTSNQLMSKATNLSEVDKQFVRKANNDDTNRTSTWMLPPSLLALIHIHVAIYFISWPSAASLISPDPPTTNSTPRSHLIFVCLSTSSFSVYSYWQLKSLLLALAMGCLSRSAGTPIHKTKARMSAHCGRKVKVRWPYIIHRAQASVDNVLTPSSIPSSSLHSSMISYSPQQELLHAAHPFVYPTTWANNDA